MVTPHQSTSPLPPLLFSQLPYITVWHNTQHVLCTDVVDAPQQFVHACSMIHSQSLNKPEPHETWPCLNHVQARILNHKQFWILNQYRTALPTLCTHIWENALVRESCVYSGSFLVLNLWIWNKDTSSIKALQDGVPGVSLIETFPCIHNALLIWVCPCVFSNHRE